MILGQHVVEILMVEGDDAAPHEFKGDLLQRVMDTLVLCLRLEHRKVAGHTVGLHAIDVMNDIPGLRSGDNPVKWHVGLTARDEIAGTVYPVRALCSAAIVGMQRIAPELPLLPVLLAEAASDCSPVTMRALRLGRPPRQAPRAVAVLLVVLEAHVFGDSITVTVSDFAGLGHISHSTRTTVFESFGNATKTKRFEQVGNACPPLLAEHVLAMAAGIRRAEVAA